MNKIIQLITGHGPFLYHWIELHPETETTNCRLCDEEEETPNHIMRFCPEVPEESAILLRTELEVYNNTLTPIGSKLSSSLSGQPKGDTEGGHHNLEPLFEALDDFASSNDSLIVFKRPDEVVQQHC